MERTFSSQGVRIFYAPTGVVYEDGEENGEGWYIQHLAVSKTDGHMAGVSDGIGPYMTFEEAVKQIAVELGKWVEDPERKMNPPEGQLIPTPDI